MHLLDGRFQFWKTFSVPSQGLKKIKREENESFVVDFWWIVSAIWGDFPVGTPTKKWCPDVDDVFEFSPLMMGRLLLTIIFIFVTQWVKLRIWWSVLKQKFGFLPTVHYSFLSSQISPSRREKRVCHCHRTDLSNKIETHDGNSIICIWIDIPSHLFNANFFTARARMTSVEF